MLGFVTPPEQPQQGKAGQLSPERTRRSQLFFSGEVLRPGWGILLFLLVLSAAVAMQTLLLQRFVSRTNTPHTTLAPRDCITNVVMAVAVTLATWVLSKREQRRFANFGLRSRDPLRNLFGGALAGIALVSALIVLLHQLGLLVFRGQVLFGASAQWKLAFEWLIFYALAAYAAECLTRGYLQYTLTRGFARVLRHSSAAGSGVQLGFWIAAVLLSVASSLLYRNSAETPLALLNTLLFGLLMAFSLWRTGSLWWALGYHTAWDWAESFLWGVPNSGFHTRDHLFLTEATGSALKSGGETGPEGSIYTLGALAAGFGILMLLHRSRVYPELWDEAARGSNETANVLPTPNAPPPAADALAADE